MVERVLLDDLTELEPALVPLLLLNDELRPPARAEEPTLDELEVVPDPRKEEPRPL